MSASRNTRMDRHCVSWAEAQQHARAANPEWEPSVVDYQAPSEASRPARNSCQQRNPPRGFDPRSTVAPPRGGRTTGPPLPFADQPVRRSLYRLRWHLRRLSRPRIKACGHAIVTPEGRVAVAVGEDGHARFRGLARCGSVWECPICQATIKRARAEEVKAVVESHGREKCVMLTLTIRHGMGDNLRELRTKLADAWRGMTRGAPWRRFKAELGVSGTIRALEVTHGRNGWHPHLHIVLLTGAQPDETEVIEVDGVSRWIPPSVGWVIDRWKTMVERYVGKEHVPDDEHGVTLTPLHDARYVSKLGLEVSDPGLKIGKQGSRTPLQIAAEWSRFRHRRDAWLWRTYCEAMRGARQLTWSAGLKRKHGIRDRPDWEVAEDEELPRVDEVVVGTIDAGLWRRIRVSMTPDGTPLGWWVLRQCASGKGMGLERALNAIRRNEFETVTP